MVTNSAPSDFSKYEIDEPLRDGGTMHIRAIRSDDKDRLLRHFTELSPASRYHRFFGLRRRLTRQDLAQLTELDFKRHVGLVATETGSGSERIVGVGRYVALPGDPRVAEVAFAILDRFQGRGIGTLLLRHLAEIARANAIAEFRAEVMGDNHRMIEVFANSGFPLRSRFDDGVVHISFPTEPASAPSENA